MHISGLLQNRKEGTERDGVELSPKYDIEKEQKIHW